MARAEEMIDHTTLLDRRRFIKSTLLAGSGLLVISVAPVRGLPILAGTVLQYLGRFAVSVGAGVIAAGVYDYLKELRKGSSQDPGKKTLSDDVSKSVYMMGTSGFTDLSKSKVWGSSSSPKPPPRSRPRPRPPASSAMKIVIPAQTPDRSDACGAFLQTEPIGGRHQPVVKTEGSHLAALMEGPSIIVIGAASEDFREEAAKTRPELESQVVAKKLFWPKGTDVRAEGKFSTGYDTPEIITTETGRLKIDYTPLGEGVGQVSVIAEKQLTPTKWDAIFGREYNLQYEPIS